MVTKNSKLFLDRDYRIIILNVWNDIANLIVLFSCCM
jgi:hypothetical protein